MAPPIGRIYHKNYEIADNKFTVQVSYQGYVPSGYLAQKKDTWLYNLLVNNAVVEMGSWYDLQDRHSSNEEVCDNLAQFWHDSQKIREAQDLSDDENQKALQELMWKCALWMHDYLIQSPGFRDFEVISMQMNEKGWEIVLTPNYTHGRLVRFSKQTDEDHINITSYIEDNELSAKF